MTSFSSDGAPAESQSHRGDDAYGSVDVRWDLTPLTGSDDSASVLALLDEADAEAERIAASAGTVASMGPADFAALMRRIETVTNLLERGGVRSFLDFATDMADPARGAAVARFRERATAIGTKVLFVELEWAALPEEQAEAFLADAALEFCRHHLRVARLTRPHLLSEPEEKIMAEKAVSGISAWTRLYDEQLGAITVDLGEDRPSVTLDVALTELQHPDRSRRQAAAQAITGALEPGLGTRAYIYNVILADKSTDDRLRAYSTWVSSRNLSNQASDESVAALVDAVVARYDIPQRWYSLKASLMGVEGKLHFADRNAALDTGDTEIGITWSEARRVVLDAFASFSPALAEVVRRFFEDRLVDAPPAAAKQGGAFCAPTVEGMFPYVLLNYAGSRRDVLTLAHELGHGVHFALSGRHNSTLQMQVPLTVAETASVFAETVTFSRLLDAEDDPLKRLGLLAYDVDSAIATVFRQVAMWRFEDGCHRARREQGELSVDAINAQWLRTQDELFGGTVDTSGYDTWWSYVYHFFHAPGYVYAYSFGQLLAMSVYERYLEVGPSFVPRYEAMLAAGGSKSPEELGAMVGCDLTDPGFWSAGLGLIDRRLGEAEALAATLPRPLRSLP